eukprot:1158006-Pelagomonas_calceolata.AAC.1
MRLYTSLSDVRPLLTLPFGLHILLMTPALSSSPFSCPCQVVGVIGVLFVPIPLLLKQGYLVWVGVISAYIFTWIPEWTAWMIICAMALYDIAAVLLPGGPLKTFPM